MSKTPLLDACFDDPVMIDRLACYLEIQNAELIAIVKMYLATAEGKVKPDLADIDGKARALLAKVDK